MRSSMIPVLTVTAVVVLALSACSAPVPQPTPTPEPTYAVTGDGVLRIGTLFASSGPDAAYSSAQVAGVEAAVREINEAGGYNGVPVEVLHRSAGDSAGSAASGAFNDLVARGVDVVIGPSMPEVAASLAPAATAANVALFSTARAPEALAADEAGAAAGNVVYFAPPESAQLGPLFAAVAASGASTVAFLHGTADPRGDALAAAAPEAAAAAGLTIAFDGAVGSSASSLTSAVTATTKAKVDAVIIATSADDTEKTQKLLEALRKARVAASALWLTSNAVVDYSALLPDTVLTGAHGILNSSAPDENFRARLQQADPAVGNSLLAAQAYDATIVAVLGATLAADDGGPALARMASAVTTAGIPCTSLGACLSVLATEPAIAYSGVSGPLAISSDGAATTGPTSLVDYTESNTYVLAPAATEN